MTSLRTLSASLLLALSALATGHASAAATYLYEGSAFNVIGDDQDLLSGYDKITASVTFDQAALDSEFGLPGNILSFSISGKSGSSFGPLNSAQIVQDSYFVFDGEQIANWFFSVVIPGPAQGQRLTLETINASGVVSDRAALRDATSGSLLANYRINEMPGTWTLQPAVAPVPEPGTWALLLAGLAGVGAVARRRKNA